MRPGTPKAQQQNILSVDDLPDRLALEFGAESLVADSFLLCSNHSSEVLAKRGALQ